MYGCLSCALPLGTWPATHVHVHWPGIELQPFGIQDKAPTNCASWPGLNPSLTSHLSCIASGIMRPIITTHREWNNNDSLSVLFPVVTLKFGNQVSSLLILVRRESEEIRSSRPDRCTFKAWVQAITDWLDKSLNISFFPLFFFFKIFVFVQLQLSPFPLHYPPLP